MTEIGETIKKIRKGKGILQKDLYKNIVSNTFATQFEKGIHKINTDAFLQILDRLLLDSKEFNKIHTTFKDDEYEIITYSISEAINDRDIERLETLTSRLEKYKHISQYKLLKALVTMNTARIKGITLPENDENKKVIVKFLSKIDDWTLSDVVFLTNFLPFVPYNMLIFQVTSIENILKKQNEIRLLCYFYNNLLDRAFLEKDYQNARIVCAHLKEIATEPEFLYFKLIAQIFSDLLNMESEVNIVAIERADSIIKFLEKNTSFKTNKELRTYINSLKN